ncbi:MAG: thioredoxin family protein [Bacilli bacterium]|nr:thioredoxin family protein [Bacilli bacterium]
MAKNGESTKKTKVNDNISSENNTIIKETITYDNTPIFSKMLICLYIIIALLALNIIISAINGNSGSRNSNNENNKSTTPSTQATADYDVSKFKAINANEFIDAYKGDETKLIYLGRPDCGFCVKFVPILTEVQNKYKFETLYLDINTVNQDDANKIIKISCASFQQPQYNNRRYHCEMSVECSEWRCY